MKRWIGRDHAAGRTRSRSLDQTRHQSDKATKQNTVDIWRPHGGLWRDSTCAGWCWKFVARREGTCQEGSSRISVRQLPHSRNVVTVHGLRSRAGGAVPRGQNPPRQRRATAEGGRAALAASPCRAKGPHCQALLRRVSLNRQSRLARGLDRAGRRNAVAHSWTMPEWGKGKENAVARLLCGRSDSESGRRMSTSESRHERASPRRRYTGSVTESCGGVKDSTQDVSRRRTADGSALSLFRVH